MRQSVILKVLHSYIQQLTSLTHVQLYREIVAAVRTGGGPDPKMNPRLAQAMERARLESVPKVTSPTGHATSHTVPVPRAERNQGGQWREPQGSCRAAAGSDGV